MRAGAFCVMAAAVCYAALPWWFPVDLLGRRIARELSAQLNRPVEVGAIQIGWAGGTAIETIRVMDAGERPGKVLAELAGLRCPLQPITTLLTGRVDRIDVEQVRVYLVVDQEGRLNIADLADQRGGPLPSHHFRIRTFDCYVATPQEKACIQLCDLLCDLTPPTGILRMSSHIRPLNPDENAPPGTEVLTFRTELTVPRLKADVPLSGSVRFDWNHLELTDLPLALVPDCPIEQLDGTTAGTVTFKLEPDRDIGFEGSMRLDEVRTRKRGQPYVAWIPEAHLRVGGSWNPALDRIALRSLTYDSDTLLIQAESDTNQPAVLISPTDGQLVTARAACQVRSWTGLKSKWPPLADRLADTETTLTGQADVRIDLHAQHGATTLEIDLDATESVVACGSSGMAFFDGHRGCPKRAHVRMETNPDRPEEFCAEVNLAAGDMSLRARSRLLLNLLTGTGQPGGNSASFEQALFGGGGELELDCRDLRTLESLSPWMAGTGLLDSATGPARFRLTWQPAEQAVQLTMAVEMAETSSLALGDWLDKRTGRPLGIEMAARVPTGMTGRIEEPSFALHHGRGRLVLDSERTRVDITRVGAWAGDAEDREIPAQMEWYLPLRIEHVEELLDAWPQWRKWLANSKERVVAGDMTCDLAGALTLSAEKRLGHLGARIEADALKVRWDDVVDKPIDRPLVVDIAFHPQDHERNGRQTLSASARRGDDAVFSQVTWTGPIDSVQPTFEHVLAKADLSDVSEWLALSPRLADWVHPRHVSGALHARMESTVIGQEQQVWFDLDANPVSFDDPRTEIRKPAGTPAQLHLALRTGPDGGITGSERAQRIWEVVAASGQLAGLNVHDCRGTIGVSSSDGATIRPLLRLLREPADVAFQSARLAFETSLVLDPTWAILHPKLADWMAAYALHGQGEASLKVQADMDGLRVAGVVRGDALGMTAAFEEGFLEALRKKPDEPATLYLDVSARKSERADRLDVAVDTLLLSLGSNLAGLQGRATLTDLANAPTAPVGVEDADLLGYLVIEDAPRWADAVRLTDIEPAQGRCQASLVARCQKGTWSITSGLVDFEEFHVNRRAEPLVFHGSLSYGDGEWNTDQLALRATPVDGTVSGHVRRTDDQFDARVGLALGALDVQGVRKMMGLLNDADTAQTPLFATSPADAARVERVLNLLQNVEAVIEMHADRFKIVLPPRQQIDGDNLAVRVELNKGPVSAEFHAVVDGGNVQGTIVSQMQVAEPMLHLNYRAESIQPGAVVEGYLRVMFPGMTATGPLTIIEESYHRLANRSSGPVYGTGHGEFIIEGGWLEGRAAPLAVTRIFPGLNLARFNFTYMHSWFNMLASGRVQHQMIFQGRFYNLYMIGHSDPDGRFRYEVGVDFLADFDSRYWADVGQGRIPLFIKDGRIDEHGQLVEERVRYMPPDRILTALFVRNNLVVTAYHMVRKRVLGEP